MIRLVNRLLFGKWVEFDRQTVSGAKFGHDIYDVVSYVNLRTYEIFDEVIRFQLFGPPQHFNCRCTVVDFLGRDIYDNDRGEDNGH